MRHWTVYINRRAGSSKVSDPGKPRITHSVVFPDKITTVSILSVHGNMSTGSAI